MGLVRVQTDRYHQVYFIFWVFRDQTTLLYWYWLNGCLFSAGTTEVFKATVPYRVHISENKRLSISCHFLFLAWPLPPLSSWHRKLKPQTNVGSAARQPCCFQNNTAVETGCKNKGPLRQQGRWAYFISVSRLTKLLHTWRSNTRHTHIHNTCLKQNSTETTNQMLSTLWKTAPVFQNKMSIWRLYCLQRFKNSE